MSPRGCQTRAVEPEQRFIGGFVWPKGLFFATWPFAELIVSCDVVRLQLRGRWWRRLPRLLSQCPPVELQLEGLRVEPFDVGRLGLPGSRGVRFHEPAQEIPLIFSCPQQQRLLATLRSARENKQRE
jgi:hypothetical protein